MGYWLIRGCYDQNIWPQLGYFILRFEKYEVLQMHSEPGGGGGGTCLFESRYPKQNLTHLVMSYHSPLIGIAGLQSPVFKVSKDRLLLLLLLLQLAPSGHHFQKCPSDSPRLHDSSWVCESPLFSSLQPQLR